MIDQQYPMFLNHLQSPTPHVPNHLVKIYFSPSISLSKFESASEDDDNNQGRTSDDDFPDGRHLMTATPNPSEYYYDQQQYHNDGVIFSGVYYDKRPAGQEIDEDGPIIHGLGSRYSAQFTRHISTRSHPSANDQMEYSRQTGHTLLDVSKQTT